MNNTIPEGIPRCAMTMLAREEWFADIDILEKITLAPATWFARFVSSPRFNRRSVSAITLGHTIYYRKLDRFDPHTARGLALLAHEAKHVEQQERDGVVWFHINYLLDYRRYGYGKKIRYEKEAYALQDKIMAHLVKEFTANAGQRPCREMAPPHTPNEAFVKSTPGRFYFPV
jgi:hypothetical protein